MSTFYLAVDPQSGRPYVEDSPQAVAFGLRRKGENAEAQVPTFYLLTLDENDVPTLGAPVEFSAQPGVPVRAVERRGLVAGGTDAGEAEYEV